MTDPLTLTVALSGVSTLMSAAGSIQQGRTAEANARALQQAAEFEARQRDIQAGQARAAAQRKAMEERRQARLAQSRGIVIGAASGAGVLDPGSVDILGDIEGEGEYRALLAMAEGEDQAKGFETGAIASRYEGASALAAGKAARRNANAQAFGTVLEGATKIGGLYYQKSLFEKYGER